MYYKYVHIDDNYPQIRKVDNVKIVKDSGNFLLLASIVETYSDLVDAAINRMAALLIGPEEALDHIQSSCNREYYEIHPVWNRMSSDPCYEALACFETAEKATEVIDKIAEAIARGDRLFDLTEYIEEAIDTV